MSKRAEYWVAVFCEGSYFCTVESQTKDGCSVVSSIKINVGKLKQALQAQWHLVSTSAESARERVLDLQKHSSLRPMFLVKVSANKTNEQSNFKQLNPGYGDCTNTTEHTVLKMGAIHEILAFDYLHSAGPKPPKIIQFFENRGTTKGFPVDLPEISQGKVHVLTITNAEEIKITQESPQPSQLPDEYVTRSLVCAASVVFGVGLLSFSVPVLLGIVSGIGGGGGAGALVMGIACLVFAALFAGLAIAGGVEIHRSKRMLFDKPLQITKSGVDPRNINKAPLRLNYMCENY